MVISAYMYFKKCIYGGTAMSIKMAVALRVLQTPLSSADIQHQDTEPEMAKTIPKHPSMPQRGP